MGAMLSAYCRQARHTACVAQGGDTSNCGCQCHYDGDMSGVVESPESIGAREDLPPIYPRVLCRVAGCGRDFVNEHGESVHYARGHARRDAPLIARVLTNDPDPDQEDDAVLDELDEVTEDPEVTETWSLLVQDALAAIAFLEGKDENELIHEVMDEWAGTMRTEHAEIAQAMDLRSRYRATQPG